MDSTRSVTGSCAGPLQGDRAVPAVGLVQELPDHLAQVQGVRGSLAALPLLLDPADHARVEAEAGAEGEPAGRHRLVLGARGARGQPQADRALPALAQRVQQGAGRLHGVVGQPQGAGEDVGGAAGDHGEAGQAVRVGAVVQQAVDDLVDRAVAAEGDHQVDVARSPRPAGRGPGRDPRYSVVTASSFISLARAWISTSRVRALVVVAAGLTTRSARMRRRVPTGWYSAQTEVRIREDRAVTT